MGEEGSLEVPAVTLGEALENARSRLEWLEESDPRVFVDGVEASRLEGLQTPVGEEDTVLLTEY